MTVREVLDILKECDPDRNIYIPDGNGDPQLVTAIGDMKHVNDDMPGIDIPDDIYMMSTEQFEELADDDEEAG